MLMEAWHAERASCPSCRREVTVRADGRYRLHRPSGHDVKGSCPGSHTLARHGTAAELVLRWHDVLAGDMVLQDDEFVLAEKVQLHEKPWGDGTMRLFADVYHRRASGFLVSFEHRADGWTAVRRYEEN